MMNETFTMILKQSDLMHLWNSRCVSDNCFCKDFPILKHLFGVCDEKRVETKALLRPSSIQFEDSSYIKNPRGLFTLT